MGAQYHTANSEPPPSRSRLAGRHGLSMIELLIALAVLSLLLAVALPRLQRAKDRAHEALLSADLERLGFHQEEYLALGARRYAQDLSTLKFTPSQGVDIQVVRADDRGWAAQATHNAQPNLHCAVFNDPDRATQPWPAKQAGEINCARRNQAAGNGSNSGGVIR